MGQNKSNVVTCKKGTKEWPLVQALHSALIATECLGTEKKEFSARCFLSSSQREIQEPKILEEEGAVIGNAMKHTMNTIHRKG